jgi:hypothetical protein
MRALLAATLILPTILSQTTPAPKLIEFGGDCKQNMQCTSYCCFNTKCFDSQTCSQSRKLEGDFCNRDVECRSSCCGSDNKCSQFECTTLFNDGTTVPTISMAIAIVVGVLVLAFLYDFYQ